MKKEKQKQTFKENLKERLEGVLVKINNKVKQLNDAIAKYEKLIKYEENEIVRASLIQQLSIQQRKVSKWNSDRSTVEKWRLKLN